jgi:hypothetical protein
MRRVQLYLGIYNTQQPVSIMALTLYSGIGLTMKVGKHLSLGNFDKAAMYFAARSTRDGRPEKGSAEYDELVTLKEKGYKFRSTSEHGVTATKPNGKWYDGCSILKEWNELTSFEFKGV